MTHTSEPWTVDGCTVWGLCATGGLSVIVDCVRGESPEQVDANSRLIASAPDLLVALKAAEQFLTPEIDRGPAINGWKNTVDMVHRAIVKAEGVAATEAVK